MSELPTGTVAFLFTDVEGSTGLWESRPEAARAAMARHDDLLRQAIEAHDGRVFKTLGDGFCAAFATATDALAAALSAQLAVHAEDWGEPGPLRVRMAVHAGAAEVREGDYAGSALNRVSRLLSAGHGGQTLFSQTAYDLVQGSSPEGITLRDLGAHSLKDLQQPLQVFQLVHPALPADFPPLRSLDVLPNNLPPQLTSFVGREQEMGEVRRLLSGTRLLTLTGAGGTGKTRLALQVAAELLDEFPDGVWLVDLATLVDPSLVAQSVASALGVREQSGRPLAETLADHLHSRTLLLVLDNCEHLLESCGQLAAQVLRSCQEVKLLTTSREPLGVVGEASWVVPPLSAPDPRHLPAAPGALLAALGRYEAIRLFADRASLGKPDFALSERNAAAVAQICHWLDGIPLAIELAAARLKVLSAEEIAGRLDDRFRLLTGGSRMLLPRHQTLRAAIDWSFELLAEPERILLRRLSVFAGGWTLKAAEVVCAGNGVEEWEVLDLQSHLIDKSLAIVEEGIGGETRYRLLGTIRQYARDRLVEAGEAGRVRTRHLDWCVALAERGGAELRGSDRALWFSRLEQEHDNLRAALEWSQASPETGEAGLRIAGALYRFWYDHGDLTEGRQWLEGALARSSGASVGSRARGLHGAGYLAWGQADFPHAQALMEESVGLYRELGERRGLARALNSSGIVFEAVGDRHRGRTCYQEGLAVAREIGAQDLISSLLNNMAEFPRYDGDFERARALYEEALAARPDPVVLLNLGLVAFAQKDPAQARRFFTESLGMAKMLGDKLSGASALEGLAGVYGIQGDPGRAARLLGATQAFRTSVNSPVQGSDLPDYERFVAGTRAAMTPEAFEAARAQGETMTLEQAIELALAENTDPTASATSSANAAR
jgi:predicted ATPase/class 3 adenylate cyclase